MPTQKYCSIEWFMLLIYRYSTYAGYIFESTAKLPSNRRLIPALFPSTSKPQVQSNGISSFK